jgi:predicted  nucleic acid-binding Zn-ribbon protein
MQELEDQIISHVTEQSDKKRDTVAAQKEVQKIWDQIEAKNLELAETQNEVMKLKIDILDSRRRTSTA